MNLIQTYVLVQDNTTISYLPHKHLDPLQQKGSIEQKTSKVTNAQRTKSIQQHEIMLLMRTIRERHTNPGILQQKLNVVITYYPT